MTWPIAHQFEHRLSRWHLSRCQNGAPTADQARRAVGDRAEVNLEGGVRRGTDIMRALAMGVEANMSERRYLYSFGAGVGKARKIPRDELVPNRALLGTRSVTEIISHYVR